MPKPKKPPPKPEKEPKPKPDRPPATLNGAVWRTSEAKQLMAQDIIDKLVPIEGVIDSEELYNRMYVNQPEFKNFPFDKVRYDGRIDRLRAAIKRLKYWAVYDAAAVARDRALHPPPAVNIRGQLRWNGSEAQKLLKIDIANGLHEQMAPRFLRMTKDEYKEFELPVFRKHIDQTKQALKPFGRKTPGQINHNKRKLGNKDKSRINEE